METRFDYARRSRIGLPESIFCEGKDPEALKRLVLELRERKAGPVLLTRLEPEGFSGLESVCPGVLDYDPASRTAFLGGCFPVQETGTAAVVTAGTSDLRVGREALRTLEYLGIPAKLFSDVGVAGLWRLQEKLGEISRASVIIAVAGMDAALVSVIGGLTPKPVIAVPSSVGYGVAHGGAAALHSMLSSCAPGITVMNIDNGYGAACAAFRILSGTKPGGG